MRENSIEWITGEDTATVTLSQLKFINLVMKLAEADPEAVEIIETPEHNDGYLVAHIGVNRVKFSTRPRLTDEARECLAERAKRNFGQKT